MIRVYPLRVRKGPFINYTYLLVDAVTMDAVIVDPGAGYDTIANLVYRTGSHVKAVLLTHHHSDHSEMASAFADNYDIPVFISRIEHDFYGFTSSHLVPFSPDSTIRAGGLEFFAHHAPGHTLGGVCYQADDCLFTGDTLFIEGCGMCFGRGSSPVDLYQSLQRIKTRIGPSVMIYPGHSYGIEPGIPFSDVLRENIYLHLNNIDHFIAFRMRKHQQGLFNFK